MPKIVQGNPTFFPLLWGVGCLNVAMPKFMFRCCLCKIYNFMSSQITPRRRNRPKAGASSGDSHPRKRQRGAYKYSYVTSKTRRGKNTWKEANVSFVYEDSDSEAEPASPSKQNHQNIEDLGLVEYDREVHGDFWTGGLKDIQRKTKVSSVRIIIFGVLNIAEITDPK